MPVNVNADKSGVTIVIVILMFCVLLKLVYKLKCKISAMV